MILSPLSSYIRKEMNLDYINYLDYIKNTYKSIKISLKMGKRHGKFIKREYSYGQQT